MKKGDRQKRPSSASGHSAHDAESGAVLQDAMPETDPAYPILAGILSLVPASRWTFARVEPNGSLVSLFGSHALGNGLAGLANELDLQRSEA